MSAAPATPFDASSRIPELESIRGIAALLIVVFHMPSWNERLHGLPVVRNGYLMVDLFFVLSGFVIYLAYGSRIGSGRELVRFQFLRWGRVYPVHAVMLVLFVLLEIAKTFAPAVARSPASQPSVNGAQAFVEQVLLLQAVLPNGHALSFNAPAWSISVEFFAYLLFGVTVMLLRQRALIAFAAICALAFVLLERQWLADYVLLSECLAGFFLGCLSCAFALSRPFRAPASGTWLCLAALLLYLVVHDEADTGLWLYPLTALLILSIVRSVDNPVRRLLRSRWLTWLGTLSYSVYMVHTLVILAAQQVLRRVLARPEALIDGRRIPQLAFAEALIVETLIVVAVLALGAVLYATVEKPLRGWSRSVLRDARR